MKAPDLAKLSPAQLADYLKIVSMLIKRSDALSHRLNLLDFEFQEVLNGVPNEQEMVRHMVRAFGSDDAPAGASVPN